MGGVSKTRNKPWRRKSTDRGNKAQIRPFDMNPYNRQLILFEVLVNDSLRRNSRRKFNFWNLRQRSSKLKM